MIIWHRLLPQRLLAVALLLLASACSPAAAADIRGKVGLSVDGFNLVSLKPGAVTELLLAGAGGELRRTFADKEGWFTLPDVPPGSYVISAFNPMFVYPEVYVDVTAKAGLAKAAYVFNKQQILVKPFVIRPAIQAQYFEARKPLDVWSFIKSPYGLIMGFMLFGIFVFPMLKVDPEEYQEAMAQLRGGGSGGGDAGGGGGGGGRQQQQRLRDR